MSAGKKRTPQSPPLQPRRAPEDVTTQLAARLRATTDRRSTQKPLVVLRRTGSVEGLVRRASITELDYRDELRRSAANRHICKACAKPIPPRFKFCVRCGVAVEDVASAAAARQRAQTPQPHIQRPLSRASKAVGGASPDTMAKSSNRNKRSSAPRHTPTPTPPAADPTVPQAWVLYCLACGLRVRQADGFCTKCGCIVDKVRAVDVVRAPRGSEGGAHGRHSAASSRARGDKQRVVVTEEMRDATAARLYYGRTLQRREDKALGELARRMKVKRSIQSEAASRDSEGGGGGDGKPKKQQLGRHAAALHTMERMEGLLDSIPLAEAVGVTAGRGHDHLSRQLAVWKMEAKMRLRETLYVEGAASSMSSSSSSSDSVERLCRRLTGDRDISRGKETRPPSRAFDSYTFGDAEPKRAQASSSSKRRRTGTGSRASSRVSEMQVCSADALGLMTFQYEMTAASQKSSPMHEKGGGACRAGSAVDGGGGATNFPAPKPPAGPRLVVADGPHSSPQRQRRRGPASGEFTPLVIKPHTPAVCGTPRSALGTPRGNRRMRLSGFPDGPSSPARSPRSTHTRPSHSAFEGDGDGSADPTSPGFDAVPPKKTQTFFEVLRDITQRERVNLSAMDAALPGERFGGHERSPPPPPPPRSKAGSATVTGTASPQRGSMVSEGSDGHSPFSSYSSPHSRRGGGRPPTPNSRRPPTAPTTPSAAGRVAQPPSPNTRPLSPPPAPTNDPSPPPAPPPPLPLPAATHVGSPQTAAQRMQLTVETEVLSSIESSQSATPQSQLGVVQAGADGWVGGMSDKLSTSDDDDASEDAARKRYAAVFAGPPKTVYERQREPAQARKKQVRGDLKFGVFTPRHKRAFTTTSQKSSVEKRAIRMARRVAAADYSSSDENDTTNPPPPQVKALRQARELKDCGARNMYMQRKERESNDLAHLFDGLDCIMPTDMSFAVDAAGGAFTGSPPAATMDPLGSAAYRALDISSGGVGGAVAPPFGASATVMSGGAAPWQAAPAGAVSTSEASLLLPMGSQGPSITPARPTEGSGCAENSALGAGGSASEPLGSLADMLKQFLHSEPVRGVSGGGGGAVATGKSPQTGKAARRSPSRHAAATSMRACRASRGQASTPAQKIPSPRRPRPKPAVKVLQPRKAGVSLWKARPRVQKPPSVKDESEFEDPEESETSSDSSSTSEFEGEGEDKSDGEREDEPEAESDHHPTPANNHLPAQDTPKDTRIVVDDVSDQRLAVHSRGGRRGLEWSLTSGPVISSLSESPTQSVVSPSPSPSPGQTAGIHSQGHHAFGDGDSVLEVTPQTQLTTQTPHQQQQQQHHAQLLPVLSTGELKSKPPVNAGAEPPRAVTAASGSPATDSLAGTSPASVVIAEALEDADPGDPVALAVRVDVAARPEAVRSQQRTPSDERGRHDRSSAVTSEAPGERDSDGGGGSSGGDHVRARSLSSLRSCSARSEGSHREAPDVVGLFEASVVGRSPPGPQQAGVNGARSSTRSPSQSQLQSQSSPPMPALDPSSDVLHSPGEQSMHSQSSRGSRASRERRESRRDVEREPLADTAKRRRVADSLRIRDALRRKPSALSLQSDRRASDASSVTSTASGGNTRRKTGHHPKRKGPANTPDASPVHSPHRLLSSDVCRKTLTLQEFSAIARQKRRSEKLDPGGPVRPSGSLRQSASTGLLSVGSPLDTHGEGLSTGGVGSVNSRPSLAASSSAGTLRLTLRARSRDGGGAVGGTPLYPRPPLEGSVSVSSLRSIMKGRPLDASAVATPTGAGAASRSVRFLVEERAEGGDGANWGSSGHLADGDAGGGGVRADADGTMWEARIVSPEGELMKTAQYRDGVGTTRVLNINDGVQQQQQEHPEAGPASPGSSASTPRGGGASTGTPIDGPLDVDVGMHRHHPTAPSVIHVAKRLSLADRGDHPSPLRDVASDPTSPTTTTSAAYAETMESSLRSSPAMLEWSLATASRLLAMSTTSQSRSMHAPPDLAVDVTPATPGSASPGAFSEGGGSGSGGAGTADAAHATGIHGLGLSVKSGSHSNAGPDAHASASSPLSRMSRTTTVHEASPLGDEKLASGGGGDAAKRVQMGGVSYFAEGGPAMRQGGSNQGTSSPGVAGSGGSVHSAAASVSGPLPPPAAQKKRVSDTAHRRWSTAAKAAVVAERGRKKSAGRQVPPQLQMAAAGGETARKLSAAAAERDNSAERPSSGLGESNATRKRSTARGEPATPAAPDGSDRPSSADRSAVRNRWSTAAKAYLAKERRSRERSASSSADRSTPAQKRADAGDAARPTSAGSNNAAHSRWSRAAKAAVSAERARRKERPASAGGVAPAEKRGAAAARAVAVVERTKPAPRPASAGANRPRATFVDPPGHPQTQATATLGDSRNDEHSPQPSLSGSWCSSSRRTALDPAAASVLAASVSVLGGSGHETSSPKGNVPPPTEAPVDSEAVESGPADVAISSVDIDIDVDYHHCVAAPEPTIDPPRDRLE